MKRHLLLMMISCASAAGVEARPVAADDPVRRWPAAEAGNDHVYEVYVHKNPLAWAEAERIALMRGGHLATLTTTEEHDFVRRFVDAVPDAWHQATRKRRVGPWIGASRDRSFQKPGEGWRWVTGERFKETFWAGGEVPQLRSDAGLLLIGEGWDASNSGGAEVRSCVIEYGPAGKPEKYVPPAMKRWLPIEGGNDHTYRIYTKSSGMTWEEAKRIARRAGGHLATLTTPEENAFVLNLAKALKEPWADYGGVKLGPWIGAAKDANADKPDEGWRWVTGEPFSETFWAPGNPPEVGGGKHVQLFPTGWDDVDADMDKVVSCVIEFTRAPVAGAPDVTPTDTPSHPAAKAVQEYFKAMGEDPSGSRAAACWHVDAYLQRLFGDEYAKLSDAARARMRRQFEGVLKDIFSIPGVVEEAKNSELKAFVVAPIGDDDRTVRVEFTGHWPNRTEVQEKSLVMHRVGSRWRVIDAGAGEDEDLSDTHRDLYRQSGMAPAEFVEKVLAAESKRPSK